MEQIKEERVAHWIKYVLEYVEHKERNAEWNEFMPYEYHETHGHYASGTAYSWVLVEARQNNK